MKLLQAQNKPLLGFLRKYGFKATSEKLNPVRLKLNSIVFSNPKEHYFGDLFKDPLKESSFYSKDNLYKNVTNTFALNQIAIKNDLVDLKFQGNHEVTTKLTSKMNSQINKDIKKQKLIRITTVSGSLRSLLTGQFKFMNQYYEVVGVSNFGEGLERVHEDEGVRTQGIKMTRSITPLLDLIATYKLYRFFKKEKPFIVHTHTPKAGTLGMLAAKMAGVPHRLHTVAGLPLLEEKGIKRIILDNVEKITYLFATKILPNSFGLENIIIENNYTDKKKLKVIANGSSNGIDTKHFNSELITQSKLNEIRNNLKIKKTDFIFIFIGRIVKDKGINELVMAFDRLSKTNDNIKLLLVGGREESLDPLSSATEKMINENYNILDLGWQKDIRPFVALANVLTFPSYREGFPNVVLQCSCMGLPCIVSDINGCNEIIEHGVNGLIIPPKDVDALEKSMILLMNSPEKMKIMKFHARPRVVGRYERQYVWNELLNYYNSLEQ